MLASLFVALTSFSGTPSEDIVTERLRAHVGFLASDSLAGRKMGSRGGEMASEYIATQFASLGLKAWGSEGYFHPFGSGTVRNVVGCIVGTQAESHIVIGAHYDHLGINKEGEIFYGADDNASGVATLIEVARLLGERDCEPRHTLLFVAFDAEESGLLGSKEFARHLPKGSVKAMVNMDMVGRLGEGSLTIEGTGTLRGTEELTADLATRHNISIDSKRFERSFLTATDTEPFAQQGIATLALTTGLHNDYHEPGDTAEKIDYEGLGLIARLTADLLEAIDGKQDVVATGKVAPKHRGSKGGFEWGATAAFGNSYHIYPKSALQSRFANGWSVGIVGQLNLTKHLALRTAATYDHRRVFTPTDIDTPLGGAQKLTSGVLTIPIDVMLKTAGTTCAYICVGGYGSRVLHAKFSHSPIAEVAPYEWGWHWGLGMRVGSLYFETKQLYAFTSTFTPAPTAQNRTTYCSFGWMF